MRQRYELPEEHSMTGDKKTIKYWATGGPDEF